jgi:hypothetical protein
LKKAQELVMMLHYLGHKYNKAKGVHNMHIDLNIRCFAKKLPTNQWHAFSLQFGLAAQGDSLTEVKNKLNSMIHDYAFDALFGPDQQYAKKLLSRSAHWSIHVQYWLGYPKYLLCKVVAKLFATTTSNFDSFELPIQNQLTLA